MIIRELVIEIDPEVAFLQPCRIVEERLLGVASRLAASQVPLPNMPCAGPHPAGAHAWNLQPFGHRRANRRKREQITPHPGDQDLHALNFDAGEPPGRNLLRRAKPLPTQLLAPLRFGSPQPTRLRSGSATPYRAGACREPRFAR